MLLSTFSLTGYDLNHIFQIAKHIGFDGIDLQVDPANYDSLDPSYLKNLCHDHKINIKVLSTPEIYTTDQIKAYIQLADFLGVETLVLQNPKVQSRDVGKWINKEIKELQSKSKVKIAIENAPPKFLLGVFPKNTAITKQDLKKYSAFSLDTALVGEKKQNLMQVYDSLKDYIVHIHLSNYTPGNPQSTLDQGSLPIESFLIKLKQYDYRGTIALKLSPQSLHAGDLELVKKELTKSKNFYEKYFIKSVPLSPDTEQNSPSDFD